MSLLQEYGQEFCFMEKTKSPDGEGGLITSWQDGAKFMMAQQHDTTIIAQQAERDASASAYTFYVDKAIKLEMYDVVKRLSDNATFRITQPTGEDITPAMSRLNLSMIKAERWAI